MHETEEKKPVRLSLRTYWNLLARHIRPQGVRFSLLLLLMLGNIGLQLVNPQIMRVFIDDALAGRPLDLLMVAAAAFIAIALAQQAVSVGVTYLGESTAWTATNALRAELARHCLSLDLGFHNEHTPGELIERINGDITQMSAFFSQFVVTLLGNLLLMLGILGVLFGEDWRVGLAFLVFAAVSLLALALVSNYAVRDWKEKRQADADLVSFIEEALSGSEDLRASGAVAYAIRELYRLQTLIFKRAWTAEGKNLVIEFVVGLVLILGQALALGTGYLLFTRGLISVGTVYLFVRYLNLLSVPILEMTREMRSFQTIGACVERLDELRRLQPVVQDGPGVEIPVGALGLSFEDVHFAYTAHEPVLRGLSFELKPGSVLGLLGRTGSGKSTLARLIFRLYDPNGGHIRLAGVELNAARLINLRGRIAMVTQEVQLFRASVRDNLTFFDRSISDARVQVVVAELGLDDWLNSLSAGLDSELEPGGRGLSAGEAQLLAMARVFLRDPGLVILDEASSRLDPATEQRIERAVEHLLRGRTAIIIAHRLGTVQRADRILILEEGRACEDGPRAALANDPSSRFSGLLRTGLEEVLV